MNQKCIRPDDGVDILYVRLDQIRMSRSERIKAKAQLARAEAVVEAVFAIGCGASRLLKRLVLRPVRRMAASLG